MNLARLFLCGCLLLVLLGSTSQLSAQDELVELVTSLLGEDDKDVRALAFDQIRKEAPGEAMTQKFAALLLKFPAETQVGLLSALADRGDTAAAPAVRELLSASPDHAVRLAALEALGSVGDQSDLDLLLNSLSDESEPLRNAARAGLIHLPSGVSPAMAQKLKQSPAELQVALIEILTARRAREEVPTLLELAHSGDASVRQASTSALAELADVEQLDKILPLVLAATIGRERDAAEKAIASICARNPDQGNPTEPLLTIVRKLPKEEQVSLLSTLGRVGGSAALAFVDESLDAANNEAHDSAVRALCNWPDGMVVSRLLKIARTDMNAANRRQALQALIRIAPLDDDRSDILRLDTLRTVYEMCSSDAERSQILERAKAIRSIDTLRYLIPYLDNSTFAQDACLTIVELAHHSSLRESHKEEFHQVLDRVIATSKDPIVVDRAKRYKIGQTWLRPKSSP